MAYAIIPTGLGGTEDPGVTAPGFSAVMNSGQSAEALYGMGIRQENEYELYIYGTL